MAGKAGDLEGTVGTGMIGGVGYQREEREEE